MGVAKKQAVRNKQAIIAAASRVFRERGVDGVGVADIMLEAGFTHGGFYNHFESKSDLAGQVCAAAFADGLSDLKSVVDQSLATDPRAFRRALENYLSKGVRDDPGQACPTATFAADAPRQGEGMQKAYAEGMQGFVDTIEQYFAQRDGLSAPVARERAMEVLVTLVGAITIARGVGAAAPRLSDSFLKAARRKLPD
jgi:TetR/AcrR family transcriptional repressor of nem operon